MASTYVDSSGRRRFSDSGKLVSRWVGERMMGRKLGPTEDVHHKNRNKLDNRPKNLRIYPGKYGHYRHIKREHSDFW